MVATQKLIEDKRHREKRAYVRFSRSMKSVEIVIPGFGPIFEKKIGGRDPLAVEDHVKRIARGFFKFHWVR